MDRRLFLKTAALAGVSAYTIGRSGLAFAAAGPIDATPRRRLVVIMLRGAVDGLSVVVPYGDDAYYQARSSIALARPGQTDGLIDLDGHFGLHPALSALTPLWHSGQLAFVQASGSPDPTRSHFDAQDYLESGTPGRKSTSDGWMNRLVGVLPGSATPTRAISVGPTLPRILSGPVAVSSMANGRGAGKPTVLDRPGVDAAFASLYANADDLGTAYQHGRDGQREVQGALAQEMMAANNGAPTPEGFPADAGRLATLIRRDAQVQVAFMALGGWDTHINQGNAHGQLANRLQPLGDGLAQLVSGLGDHWQNTTVVVMSEFGRTVRQNGNGGTDHGHGNVMWVLGGPVNGGRVYGQWPGLDEASLHEGRDLAVTTDFRSVLGGVLSNHLQLNSQQLALVLPQAPAPMAGLIKT